MKKNLFFAVGLCLAITGWSQQAQNKHLAAQASHDDIQTDVSGKSMIRFNTDITTPAERQAADEERHANLVAAHPTYDADRNAYEAQVLNYVSAHQNDPSEQMTITLPVVVHVIWKTTAQNIPDNQVLSQIQVLNEDFSRTNSDANTHWSQASATTIQFCLAQQDPSGNPTTGIERRQTTVTSFGTNDAAKSYSTGGLDAWDPTRYLNIWVCNLGGGLLGYGEFPTSTVSQTFGVVILYSAFGSNFTSYGTFSAVASPYDRGRTTTHEFSHCFNLYHIWGDDGGSCSGSDNCSDTPNQADATTTCYTFPHTDACSTTNPGIMFENYMDYSYDNCLNLFTAGQKTRMLAVLNQAPYNALQTSNGCQSPTTSSVDAGISAITSPGASVCGLTFTPVVTLKNFGTSVLTSCTINYKIDASTVQTYNWTGSLASNATTSVTLSSMTTTAGTHTFTAYTSNPNSTTDGSAGNDQSQVTFTATSSQTLPYTQGFENATFPPTGCTINNPDNSTTWARTTVAAKTGSASMFMDNNNYAANGEVDEFILPALNLQVSNPVLTFQLAYQLYTDPSNNPNYSDTLRVMISTDCGSTWTQIYFKYGTNLVTATPQFSSIQFVPTASDWRLETIPLTSYMTAGSAIIKFRHTTDYENQLYVDDINIQNATGVQSMGSANFINLFPNPSNTGLFNLDVELSKQQNVNVTVTNALGQVVDQFAEVNSNGGSFPIDLSAQPDGVYFVTVTAGDDRAVQRIVISR